MRRDGGGRRHDGGCRRHATVITTAVMVRNGTNLSKVCYVQRASPLSSRRQRRQTAPACCRPTRRRARAPGGPCPSHPRWRPRPCRWPRSSLGASRRATCAAWTSSTQGQGSLLGCFDATRPRASLARQPATNVPRRIHMPNLHAGTRRVHSKRHGNALRSTINASIKASEPCAAAPFSIDVGRRMHRTWTSGVPSHSTTAASTETSLKRTITAHHA